MTDGVTTTMPVAPVNYGGDGGFGGGFGGGWAWIVIFFLIFAVGGWGGGWGNNGGANGTLPGYTQTNDFSNLERENDIIRQDICQNFATLNGTLSNQFANIVDGMHQGFSNMELSQSNQTANLMGQMYTQNLTALQQSCDTARQIGDGFNTTNFNMATQGNDTRTLMANNTRDIIEAQNNGTRAILDAMTAQRIADKDERIAELTSQLNNANLAASQARQNNYLVDTLRPAPVPSYQVQNPWANNGCGCYTCGMGA